MKTSLTSVSLVLAAGFPGSLLAELAGLPLPTALDAGHTFGVFVAVLTLLTACADYAGRPRSRFALADGDSPAPSSARTAAEIGRAHV